MLQLYDTLTREKLAVSPSEGETLRFYCCGPTVYGPSHIGNFRSFLVQDLFRRVVELGGIKTKHVRNLTDVDDKTIRRSQEEGKSLAEFTNFWGARFHADCNALHILRPHEEPSAVKHIAEQIALIEILMAKEHAYRGADGSVYFSVSSYADYGKLSRLDKRELRLGSSQTAHDADEYEKDSLADFALWKAHKPEDGPNAWDSPWGRGRPGWHLECSAMGMKYLGESFDLHSGGVDLCFPHHENEIAQSEAATGVEFVRHWFHISHLRVEGEKMSKSLGNLYTLADLEEKGWNADEMRYTLLAGHYRQPLNFTFDTMHAAQHALHRLGDFAEKLLQLAGKERLPDYEALLRKAPPEFGVFRPAWEALLDDLNAPEALGQLFKGVKEVETKLKAGQVRAEEAGEILTGLGAIVAAFGWALPAAAGETGGEETPEEIRELAQQRWEAKQAKDWAKADELRDALKEKGWAVKDGTDGYELTSL